MGPLQSRESAPAGDTANVNYSRPECEYIGGCGQPHQDTVLGAVEDIQKLSNAHMETEFQQLYQRSRHILGTLASNPCESLAQNITQCLESNRRQMYKCFIEMDAYRGCVAEHTREKIAGLLEGDVDAEEAVTAKPEVRPSPEMPEDFWPETEVGPWTEATPEEDAGGEKSTEGAAKQGGCKCENIPDLGKMAKLEEVKNVDL